MSNLKSVLVKEIPLLGFIFITSVIASLLEGATLGLVIPILEVVKGGSGTPVPYPFRYVTDYFAQFDPMVSIQLAAGLMVVLTAFKGLSLYLSNVLSYQLQIKVIKHYRMLCFKQLMNVGISYINLNKKSHFQAVFISLTSHVGTLVKTIGILTPKAFTILVLLSMLITLSWKMTLVSLGLAIVISLSLYKLVRRAGIIGEGYTKVVKQLNDAVLEALMGLKVIRLFSRESDRIKQFDRDVDDYNDNLLALTKARGALMPLFEVIGVGCLAVMLVVGSILFANFERNGLDIILVFFVIFFRMLSPSLAINHARFDIRSCLPSMREVDKFIDPNDKPYLENGERKLNELTQGIELKGVSFKYNEEQSMVLEDISFSIPKGKKVGVVGASGSGKSTLAELLLRFYDPNQGQILVDGHDLKEFDIYSWRKRIGVVSQDIFLFNDTVKANITFSNPEATEAEIERAVRRAHAYEFIKDLPNGYDTLIGDRGVLLSGGQRQRIAIARAILNEPEILVFDEATSALDTESERIVQQALDEIGQGKTVVTIAHRLSTVKDSDWIVVIDRGRIMQQGTHQDLLENKEGLYRKFVTMQDLEPQTI